MFAFLNTGWIKIVAILATALGLVGTGIFVANTWYDRGAQHQLLVDRAEAAKHIQADQTKITEAVHSNDQELLDLRTYRDAHPPLSVRVSACVPGHQAAAPHGAGSAPAAPAVVQSVSHADPDSNLSDADRGAMLQALAAVADESSARLRAVQAVK